MKAVWVRLTRLYQHGFTGTNIEEEPGGKRLDAVLESAVSEDDPGSEGGE